MIVAAAQIELHVHASHSLKEKRGVVRSLSRRLKNRLNVSVAEVGGQDTWQRVVLGIAVAGSSELRVRQQIEQAVEFVEETHLAELTGNQLEIFETGWAEVEADDDDETPLPWENDGDSH